MLVIDKPPVSGGKPPELPPYLRKRGGPERRTFIMPNYTSETDCEMIPNEVEGWITCIYPWMRRISVTGPNDPNPLLEVAHSHSREYKQWLTTYHYPSGIPPHIQLAADPMCRQLRDGESLASLLQRWEDWVRKTFC